MSINQLLSKVLGKPGIPADVVFSDGEEQYIKVLPDEAYDAMETIENVSDLLRGDSHDRESHEETLGASGENEPTVQ